MTHLSGKNVLAYNRKLITQSYFQWGQSVLQTTIYNYLQIFQIILRAEVQVTLVIHDFYIAYS